MHRFHSKLGSSSLRAERCWVLHDNDTNNLIERGRDCLCKTSICQTMRNQECPIHHDNRNIWRLMLLVKGGNWAPPHDTKQRQSQVKYYVLKVIGISHIPATAKTNKIPSNPQNKNPITFNLQQNSPNLSPQEICDLGSSYNTSEGYLYSILCLNIFQVCWSHRFPNFCSFSPQQYIYWI